MVRVRVDMLQVDGTAPFLGPNRAVVTTALLHQVSAEPLKGGADVGHSHVLQPSVWPNNSSQ